MTNRSLAVTVLLLPLVLEAAAGTQDGLKVGFIYVGPVGDYGMKGEPRVHHANE